MASPPLSASHRALPVSLRLHQFNGTDAEVVAALALRKVAGVTLRLDSTSEAAKKLSDAGFVPMPIGIQMVRDLSKSSTRPRARRRNLKAATEAWAAAGAQLVLTRAAEVGPDVRDELYFGLLVPQLYARGWSPFGIHNHRAFQRLIDAESWVALVRCEGRLCGGGLLRVARPGGVCLAGGCPPGPQLLGQVYALCDSLAPARRAFLMRLEALAHEAGFESLSLGEDLPWMQRPYVNVVLEKLQSADAVFFRSEQPTLWGHFDNFGDDVLCFVRTESGIELRAPSALSDLADRLSRRIMRLRA